MPTEPTTTPPTSPTPPQPGQPAGRFFDWMRRLGIVRQPGWIGGVCAGIAARLGIDAIIVRGIVVVLAIFGGPALLLYAAAWLLLPDNDDDIHLERLIRGQFEPAVIGVGVLFLLALLPLGGFWSAGPALWLNPGNWGAGFWGWPGQLIWVLVVIGAIVWFVVWASRHSRDTGAWPMTGVPTTPPAAASAAAQTEADVTMAFPTDGPTPPPVPEGADPDDLAAWKVQQANWKREHDAWKMQQAASERAVAKQRADEHRRIRQQLNEERRAEWAERNRRTRSNPLFTLIAVGTALVAGAAVVLALGGGNWTVTTAITGLSVTLAVLGLAIVINGFRGKRSGGAGGVAVLVTIALVLSSLFGWIGGPVIQNRSLDWSPSYSGEDWSQRTVINGAATLDHTDYFTGPTDSGRYDNGRVRLVVINGDVEVTVPAEEFSEVRANSVNGSITTTSDATHRGPFASADVSFTPSNADARKSRDVFVQVWALNGDVTISQATR
jgi:phage shock protein PspC (stress-responsive transcriptional regulator)